MILPNTSVRHRLYRDADMTGTQRMHANSPQPQARASETGLRAARGWTPRVVVSLISMCLLLQLLATAYLLMAIALPAIAAKYQTTHAAWLPAAFLLISAMVSPLAGKLANSYGKRRIMMACVALSALGALIAANAPTFGLLLVGCALMGMLDPCVFLVYTLIPDVFPKRTVSMSVSVVMSSMGLAAIPAPFIGGWLLGSFGIHSIFWFLFASMGFCGLAVRLTTTETDFRQRSRIDLVGATLLGAGIAGGLAGISFTPQWGLLAPATLACLAGGIAALIAWAVSARRIRQPLIDIRLLKDRSVVMILATTGLAFAVSAVYVVVLPFLAMAPPNLGLGYGFGLDANGYAVILAAYGAATLAAGIAVGWLVKHLGPRVTMMIGMFVMAVAITLTAVWHDAFGWLIAFATLMGLGTGCAYASGPNLIMTFIPQPLHGIIGSTTNVSRAILPAALPVTSFAILNSNIALHVDGHVLYSDAGIAMGLMVGVIGAVVGIAAASCLPRSARHPALMKIVRDMDHESACPASG